MEHVIYERPDTLHGFGNDQEHFFTTKKVSLKDRICLSPMVKYVVPAFAIIALLMATVYTTMYFFLVKSDDDWPATCNIRPSYRVECFPGRKTNEVTYDDCTNVGCCWSDADALCFHSIPSRHGYTPENSGPYAGNAPLVPRRATSPLGARNAESASLGLTNVDETHVVIILKISETTARAKTSSEDSPVHEASTRRSTSSRRVRGSDELSKQLLYFLPDNPERRTVNLQDDVNSKMDVYVHSPEFSVTVTRKGDTTSRPLLSTARGPLILTENFWEITLYITNSTIYGLNRLQLNGTTSFVYNNGNETARPAFLGIDDRGQGTSCYVDYDGPMEIQVLDKSNLVVLRGFSLPREIAFHVFAGPSPLEAARQLTVALQKDSHPAEAPLSSLGLHVCPNDDTEDIVESLSSTIASMATNQAPWDSHCLHQGFNPTLGNTLDENKMTILAEAQELLAKDDGGRIITPHLSPMLFYSDNSLIAQLADSSLLLRDSDGPYVGLYCNQSVVYPDWLDRGTFEASRSNITDYLTKFAASKLLYIRDSWPRDETQGQSKPANPRFGYLPRGLARLMSSGTVPYNLLTSARKSSHHAEHNAYAEKFRDASALPGWTSLTIRGLWGESGNSSWAALREAVRAGVASGLVGQLPGPMYVCGTGEDLGHGDNSDELCSRWYGAAVAWPHVLVLPANLPGGAHLAASASTYAIKHLKLRAALLTYTLTKLAEHRAYGSPLLAPTSTHYPRDLRARERWNQFLWGDSILVGLVTLPGVSQVLMWLPGKYSWRHLHGGLEIHPSNASFTSVTAAEGQIVTLVRPGFIVPLHEEISMTSSATFRNQLRLVINLECDAVCFASGKIFYGGASDGEFLSISADDTTVRLENVRNVIASACGTVRQQATLIKYVEILGNVTYDIHTELCSLPDDSIAINLSKTKFP